MLLLFLLFVQTTLFCTKVNTGLAGSAGQKAFILQPFSASDSVLLNQVEACKLFSTVGRTPSGN